MSTKLTSPPDLSVLPLNEFHWQQRQIDHLLDRIQALEHGGRALGQNTTGTSNTAIGASALISNTTAGRNTALGTSALFSNTTGDSNTALGSQTLSFNTTGQQNVALGEIALNQNQVGSGNTAVGRTAGFFTTGNNNIYIDHQGVAGESGRIRVGTSGTKRRRSSRAVAM